MNDQESIRTFFVYGTLKQGECREHAWPVPPESVIAATTRGQLFDLGEYPAMTKGDDLVCGELWRVSETGFAETLRVLDAIEGYRPGDENNLYERRVVDCHDVDGNRHRAFTYFYLHPLSDGRIQPQARGQSIRWTQIPD